MLRFQYNMERNESGLFSSITGTTTMSDISLNQVTVKAQLDEIFTRLNGDVSGAIINFIAFKSNNNTNNLTTLSEQSCNHTDKLLHLIVIHKSGVNNTKVLSDSCLKIPYNTDCLINVDNIIPIFNQIHRIVSVETTNNESI